MNKLPTTLSKKVILDKFVKVTEESLRYEDNSIHPYYTVTTKSKSVAILALSDSNELLVVHEYRHPTKKVLLSCPGGFLEDGEDPLKGAERELLEESGCSATNFQIITTIHPLPSLCDSIIFIVLATNAKLVQKPRLEPQEILSSSFISQKEIAKVLLSSDHGVDGVFCSALFFLNQLKLNFLADNNPS